MDQSTMKTVVLGKLPVARGEYDSTKTYYKYNIVTYYGSAFISNTDNNTNPPLINAEIDASGFIVSYDGVSPGWDILASAIESAIHAASAGDYAQEMGDYAKEMGDDLSGLVVYDSSQPKLTIGEPAETENKNLIKIGVNVHDSSFFDQWEENRGQVLIGNNFTSAQPGVFVYTSNDKGEGQGELDKLLTSNNKTTHCIVACDVSINNPDYSGNVGNHPNVILGANLYHTYGTNRKYGTLLGQYNDEIDASVPNTSNSNVTFVVGAGESSTNKFNPITVYKDNNGYHTLLNGEIMVKFNGEYKNVVDQILAEPGHLTPSQQDAVNSGITSELVSKIEELPTVDEIDEKIAQVVQLQIQVVDSSLSATLFDVSINTYYRFDITLNEITFNFPEPQQTGQIQNSVLYFSTGSDVDINMTSTLPIDKFDSVEIEDNGTYEINAIFNGARWVIAIAKVIKENL